MLFFIFAATAVLFGFVLLFGAPYLPTLRREANAALDMLDLKKGQTLFELGSGDGRVMKIAAARGLNVVGYELKPILVLISRINTWRYRKQVKVIWGNFWKADLSQADGIFVFLLDKFMERIDKKIEGEAKMPVAIVSYAFRIPHKKPTKSKGGLFLYEYK